MLALIGIVVSYHTKPSSVVSVYIVVFPLSGVSGASGVPHSKGFSVAGFLMVLVANIAIIV